MSAAAATTPIPSSYRKSCPSGESFMLLVSRLADNEEEDARARLQTTNGRVVQLSHHKCTKLLNEPLIPVHAPPPARA